MRLQDVPAPDKIIVTGGAAVSTILTMDYIETMLALIIAAMTIMLLGLRIALAFREWRQGKEGADD